MPEVLEIQIQDKGGSGMSGPPRPPSGNAGGTPAPGSASPKAPVKPPMSPSRPATGPKPGIAASAGEKKPKDAFDEIAGHLGVGKLYKAIKELMGIGEKEKPSPPKLPQTSTGKENAPKPPQVQPATQTQTPPKPPKASAKPAPPPAKPPSPSAVPATPSPPRAPKTTAAPSPPSPPRVTSTPSTPRATAEPVKTPRSAATAPPMPPRAATPATPKAPLQAPKAPAAPTAGNAAARAGAEAAGLEGAAGAMGGLAAGAGPIGAALVVADVAAKKVAAGFDSVRDTVEGFGHQVALAAGNDYLGMFKKGLESVHHPLKNIPIAGQMYEAQMQAAIAPVKAFTEVVEAFNHRAKELEGYSPAITMASVRGDIRSLFDDIKEANTLGPDLARMLDAQNQMSHDLREMLLPIKKEIAELSADVLEGVSGLVTTVRELVERINQWMEENRTSMRVVKGSVIAGIPILGSIAAILGAIKGNTDPKQSDADMGQWMRELFDLHFDEGPSADRFRDLDRDPRPNIPIVP